MAGELIWAFRVMRLPLLDAGGSAIGRVQDIVAVPSLPGTPPRVTGLVAESQRRRIFVNANRIAELDNDGVRLRSWDLDLNPFHSHAGEVLLGADVIDQRVDHETVSDVGLDAVEGPLGTEYQIVKVRLVRRHLVRRRPLYRLVDVADVPGLFPPITGMAAEAARLRDRHPSEVAAIVRALPPSQRRQLAEAMDDERLADLLEELPEDEQVRLVQGLDFDRLVDVLEEMELDDLADLVGEMPSEQQERILAALDAEEADALQRLLSYEEGTAGGMMTPEVIILSPSATVADALAQIRQPDRVVSIATQVFVCEPPYRPPTGRLLGTAHVQRLLRESPRMPLRDCLSHDPVVAPDATDLAVAELLASYDMLAVAVCDQAGRLLGAVTVDDVLDRQLGTGWRDRGSSTRSGALARRRALS